ncbi:D-lactate dehydrogenase (cytochrome) [Fusarium oxysporum f. sp. pisi HDV247]|uniref:D-lactate dehydrogenase (Cytochrome) n=1 Tax=Fusarium oxysporum f. sp. pisi HDV247 TaxID=1080344 RepID=W9N6Z4_FUSOX|nr:D-lactate dehydrogenase (cytochrome) [Fusarium oxysporum f. sp. pisi HDV247]
MVPMVPYGAGSSVEGNVSTPYSGITIDLSQMNRILEFNSEDMDIAVEPGVNWVQLNEEIKSSGLFLPLDPSPTALVGGMVATNCSGTNAMRYGTMKDWVLSLTVVLADGSVIKTRRRARKTSAGYNLNALFTGSEGTLGIVTQATLKLAVLPVHFAVVTTAFDTVKDAASAASIMIRKGLSLAALELMDETQMKVINQTARSGGKAWLEKPTLFIKLSGMEGTVQDSIKQVETICKEFDSDNLQVVQLEQDMNNLWSARKQALWSMLAVRPEGTEIRSTQA